MSGDVHPRTAAAIIGELAMFRGGYHDLPYDDPLMCGLRAQGLVVLVEGHGTPWWAPTREGIQLLDPVDVDVDEPDDWDPDRRPCGCPADYHTADCPHVTDRFGPDEPEPLDPADDDGREDPDWDDPKWIRPDGPDRGDSGLIGQGDY
jgi:hypothetical protein